MIRKELVKKNEELKKPKCEQWIEHQRLLPARETKRSAHILRKG